MKTQRPVGLFITGTDTGVGKTYVAARIARALHAAGCRVGVYKPVASGCRAVDGELVSDDAVELWNAAGRPGDLAHVCPQRFAAPLAPHLAARQAGEEVSVEQLRTGLDFWRERSDVLVVEGAGGLISPLTDDEYVADLATDFGFPLVVVTDNRLGTIHRTLSTLIVAATYGEGLDVAGVIVNDAHGSATAARTPSEGGKGQGEGDADADQSAASNLQELRSRCVPPVLGLVRWQGELPDVDWLALAERR